jgi:hypothetical protein
MRRRNGIVTFIFVLVLPWVKAQDYTTLDWSVFAGKPDYSSPRIAWLVCEFQPTLKLVAMNAGLKRFEFSSGLRVASEDSWVKKEFAYSALLRHEQVHFDIWWVFSIRAKADIEMRWFNFESEALYLWQKWYADARRINKEFDNNTDHGTNSNESAWELTYARLVADLRR